jgi:hypothetical protein
MTTENEMAAPGSVEGLTSIRTRLVEAPNLAPSQNPLLIFSGMVAPFEICHGYLSLDNRDGERGTLNG